MKATISNSLLCGCCYDAVLVPHWSGIQWLTSLGSLPAVYCSSGHRVLWWVLKWIERSHLLLIIFLVISVACFSAGSMLFIHTTEQILALLQEMPNSTTTSVFRACIETLPDHHFAWHLRLVRLIARYLFDVVVMFRCNR
ncbi:hypothetical protein DFH29DRAFT_632622 [Suillus ampliporus]|nr:hypothetical protein DFH29DRAFT_632622 [Suillus ampliporus]